MDYKQIEKEIYEDLLEKGKREGKISIDEIYSLFDGFDSDVADRLVEELTTKNIKVIDNGTVAPKRMGEAEVVDDGSGISALLRDLKQYPSLTAEENIELAKRIEAGDEEAKEQMIACNMWLVISMAHKYLGKGVELEDLVQDGAMGLMVACDKYDYRRGIKFGTYAFWWIRLYLRTTMANCGQVVKLPMYIYNKLCNFKKAFYELQQQYGRAPTEEEIAKSMGESLDRVKTLVQYNRAVVELDAPVGDDEDGTNSHIPNRTDVTEISEMCTGADYTMDAVARQVAYENIIGTFDILSSRERAVIECRYGIGKNAQTLDTIGRDFRLTKERIRQIESSGLRKLRHPSNLKRIYGVD